MSADSKAVCETREASQSLSGYVYPCALITFLMSVVKFLKNRREEEFVLAYSSRLQPLWLGRHESVAWVT